LTQKCEQAQKKTEHSVIIIVVGAENSFFLTKSKPSKSKLKSH
jgi:hypothetical protein